MDFATLNSSTIYNVGSIIFLLIGSLTFLLTYLRGAVNKSNHDIDQNTINSLKENNLALTNERDSWRERALDAEGQNKVLQNTITAAPEIAKLAKQTAIQHKASMKIQNDTLKVMKHLVTSLEAAGHAK